jgi:hypothetical protein
MRRVTSEPYDVFVADERLPGKNVVARVHLTAEQGAPHTIVVWKGQEKHEILDYARLVGGAYRMNKPLSASTVLSIDANGSVTTPDGTEVGRAGRPGEPSYTTARNVEKALKTAAPTNRAGVGSGRLVLSETAFRPRGFWEWLFNW